MTPEELEGVFGLQFGLICGALLKIGKTPADLSQMLAAALVGVDHAEELGNAFEPLMHVAERIAEDERL